MHDKFIARQPILDTRLRVFAYELLFRGGPQNAFRPYANASASVIADSITLFDLKMLTGNARAFINVDEVALQLNAVRLLPADRVVVEILEDVRPTPEILSICRELRASGYELALDDYTDAPQTAPFLELAKYLKVDFKLLDEESRERVAKKFAKSELSLIAEKVETEREFNSARALGYCYFQGYFFCKPSMVEARDISGNRLIQLQLLNAVSAAELDHEAIETLLKQDPSLLYRLLRYLNSPILGFRSEITSIRHAIALLGDREFRRWASIFTIISLSDGKSPELVKTALTRAFFCEEFSGPAQMEDKRSNLFLMGLLSVSDALFDRPIQEVLQSIPVAEEVKTALNGGSNRFREVFDVLLAMERAEWPELSAATNLLKCDEAAVPDSYQAALNRASSIGG